MGDNIGRWDLIVVGAGSAGAVIAARLSENPDRRVLLLEAGRDYTVADAPPEQNADDPLLLLDQTRFPEFVWSGLKARTTPSQEPVFYARGRGVGGSSAINGRLALRPPMDEFEMWARAGGEQWGPDQILQSFIKLEDDIDFGDKPYHGKGGPTPITRQKENEASNVHMAFLEAARAMGAPWCEDVNAPGTTGVSWFTYSGIPGRRYATNDAYIEPVRDRENLDIRGDVLVSKVVLEGNRAVGVEGIVNGERVTFYADEVVLSAGAIGSPAILQRSGIGPAEHLRSLGIATVADLPVGHGLQDHPSAATVFPLADGYRPPTGAFFLPIFRASSGEPGALENDFQIQGIAPAYPEMFPFSVIAGTLNHVTSSGTVLIRSTDPSENPEVDLNLLSTDLDLKRMRMVIQLAVELAKTPEYSQVTDGPAQRFNLSWEGTPEIGDAFEANGAGAGWTGRASQQDSRGVFDKQASDRDIKRWLLDTVSTSQHASSTCRLGEVVGPNANVLGIDGLRVADASIAPACARANMNLTSIMIGEHVAAMMAA